MVYTTAHPGRTEPVSVEDLAATNLILYDAHAGWRDPTRRRLAERPLIEVEQLDTAEALAHSR